MKGIRQALRDEFGQTLADQEFKFTFDEDAKQMTITVAAWSCVALNLWMVDLLDSNSFGQISITFRNFAAWTKNYERFVVLGDARVLGTSNGTSFRREDQKLPFRHHHWCPYRQGDRLARIPLGLSDHLHLFGCGGVSSGGGRPGQVVARHCNQRKSRRRDQ